MRVLVGDNMLPTLPNIDVEDNRPAAASKGICVHFRESIYGNNYKKVKVLNNKLKEKFAKCNAFICKKTYHRYFVCGKCY